MIAAIDVGILAYVIPIVLGAVALFTLAGSKTNTHYTRQDLEALSRRVAEELGLRVSPGRLAGTIDGFEVEATILSVPNTGSLYDVVVRGGLSPDLRIGKASALGRHESVKTGDPSFDRAVNVVGPEDLVLATFGDSERTRVHAAVEDRWKMEGGEWRWRSPYAVGETLAPAIKEGIELARLVRRGQCDIAAGLAWRVQDDCVSEVRKRAVGLLVERHRATPAMDSALAALRVDTSIDVRLAAGKALADPRLLLDVANEPRATPEERVEALDAVVRTAPTHPGTVALVNLWLEDSNSGSPFKRAAIRALQTVPHASAESRLVVFLENEDNGIILEAISALGFVGSVDVVKALLPFREDLLSPLLGKAAAAAIARIQGRVSGPTEGALTFAEESGGLSIHPNNNDLP